MSHGLDSHRARGCQCVRAHQAVHLCSLAVRVWARGPNPASPAARRNPGRLPGGEGTGEAVDRQWLLTLTVTLLRAVQQRQPTGPREAGDRRGAPSPPPSDLAQPLSVEGPVGRKQLDGLGESGEAWEPAQSSAGGPGGWGPGPGPWGAAGLRQGSSRAPPCSRETRAWHSRGAWRGSPEGTRRL